MARTTFSYRDGPGHVLASTVLVVLMLAILATPIITSFKASFDASARDLAAKRAALPLMPESHFIAAVDQLITDANTFDVESFESYFAIIGRERELELLGSLLDSETGSTMVRMKLMALRNASMTAMNRTMYSAWHQSPDITRSDAFVAAQSATGLAEQQVVAARSATPDAYTWFALGRLWLLALLFCIPFAMIGIAFRLRREDDLPWGAVALAFISDWRVIAASCSGPFALAIASFMLYGGEPVEVRPRNLAFALMSLISLGGGGVSAARAQAPSTDAKKPSFSKFVTERVESDESGTSSTTIAGLTYLPTHSSFEGIVVKGNGFTRTYGLYVQRLKTAGTKFSASFSSVLGVMTFKAKGADTNVYAVMGARASIAGKRWFWNTPHAAIELPVRGNASPTSAVITRPGFKLTPRVSIVNEWFGRFTKGQKPKVTSYLLANVKLTKNLSIEAGPYRTGTGLTGLRLQAGMSW